MTNRLTPVGPLSMGQIMRKNAFVYIVAIVLSACGREHSSDSTALSQDDYIAILAPPAEKSFIAAKDQANAQYDSAINDIVRKQVIDNWQSSVCNAITVPTFDAWSGKVSGILADGGFIVELEHGVFVEGDATEGSPVFHAISQLQEGETVKISGSFKPDAFNPKCPVDMIANPFGNDVIKKPDFGVVFSRVEPG